MSDIYLSLTETPSVVTLSQPVVSGALASTVTVANTVTVTLDADSLSALENVTVTVGAAISGTVTVANFPASQTVQGTVTVGSLPLISGSVTVNNFPPTQTIAGTVTARTDLDAYGNSCVVVAFESPAGIQRVANVNGFPIRAMQDEFGTSIPLPISGTVTIGNSVTIGSLPAISGTVTANLSSVPTHGVTIANSSVTVNGTFYQATQPISGTVTANISGTVPVSISSVTVGNSVTIGSLPAISGTVTANNPNGALTTRFGSVTTASVAQLTSCVTNTSRKYLLAQNISAGTVTIGIGFSPTTTQGIQLASGGGLTFDAFCPTGAVYWLGAVTGAAFTILEG